MLEKSGLEVHYTPTGFPPALLSQTLPQQSSRKAEKRPSASPEIQISAKRGMPKRSLALLGEVMLERERRRHVLTGCRRAWELLRGGCCLEEGRDGRDGLNSAGGRAQHLGSGTDEGALRSRAVPPALWREHGWAGVSSWRDSGCFDTYSGEARCKKNK